MARAPRTVFALAAGVLFAAGVLVGATLGAARMQQRVPSGASFDLLRVIGPSTVPLYAAALSFPLFVLLARRAPLNTHNWLRTAPLWIAAVMLATLIAELSFGVFLALYMGGVRPLGFAIVRFFDCFPAVLGSAAIALVVEYISRADRAEADAVAARAALSEARLGALMEQLRPHFLFNTLQTISTLVYRDPRAADEAIGRLGELLRASLQHSATGVVALREELRLTEEYFAIARERFGERLQATIDAESTALDAAVPLFVLQPLTENALRHAVQDQTGPAIVTVSARRHGDALVLEVRDNGGGLNDSASGAAGVGLSNTRARLDALYGARHELSVLDRPGGGALVRIRLPFSMS